MLTGMRLQKCRGRARRRQTSACRHAACACVHAQDPHPAHKLVGGRRVRQREDHVVAGGHELVQLVRREHLAAPTQSHAVWPHSTDRASTRRHKGTAHRMRASRPRSALAVEAAG
jgi:hypothetical protein